MTRVFVAPPESVYKHFTCSSDIMWVRKKETYVPCYMITCLLAVPCQGKLASKKKTKDTEGNDILRTCTHKERVSPLTTSHPEGTISCVWVKIYFKALRTSFRNTNIQIQNTKVQMETRKTKNKDKILLYQQRNRNIFGQEGQKKKENGIFYERVQQYDFIHTKKATESKGF